MSFIITFLKSFLLRMNNYFFPERCSICEKEISFRNRQQICSSCISEIPRPFSGADTAEKRCSKCSRILISESEYCTLCRKRDYLFIKNTSLWDYSDIAVKTLLHNYKFRNYKNAFYFFSEKIASFYLLNYPGFAVIPVPCSRKRLNKNGWDHMKVISAHLKKLNIPVFSILKRKSGVEQKKLSSAERTIRIRNRFTIIKGFDKRNLLHYRGILIIDDIFTTGSTVNECSRVLAETGNNNIHILTLALD